MKDADVRSLVRHRLEQAQTALEDAKFLAVRFVDAVCDHLTKGQSKKSLSG